MWSINDATPVWSVTSLYKFSLSAFLPFLKPPAGDTIGRAPTVPAPVDGMIVGRPCSLCGSRYVGRSPTPNSRESLAHQVRCGLTPPLAPDHAR